MKRTAFFLITLMLMFSAAGSRDTIASLDRAMVHAVGIDRTDNGYRATLQVFRPDSPGSETQLDAAKSNVFVISAEAPSVEECMTVCEGRLGEFLFIGHVQLIVLGKGVELDDPQRLFAYFLKSKESYMGVAVACADSAGELLSAELPEGAVAAQSILNIIDRHAENSVTVKCDLLGAVNSEGRSIALPLLRLVRSSDSKNDNGKKPEDDPPLTVSAEGAKVFVGGREKSVLTAEECTGLALLTGEGKRIHIGAEDTSVSVGTGSRSIGMTRRGNSFEVAVTVEISVPENQSTDLLFGRGELRRICEQRISELCGSTIGRLRELGVSDILGGSDLVKSRYPQVWLDCGGDSGRLGSLIGYRFEVRCGSN